MHRFEAEQLTRRDAFILIVRAFERVEMIDDWLNTCPELPAVYRRLWHWTFVEIGMLMEVHHLEELTESYKLCHDTILAFKMSGCSCTHAAEHRARFEAAAAHAMAAHTLSFDLAGSCWRTADLLSALERSFTERAGR